MAASLAVAGQKHGHGNSRIPLVYAVENMGADYPAPGFPAFDYLPIVRPLPDPFRFFDGKRSASFKDWERRRNEIKASIETFEIGPRPDGSDCSIEASYTPPLSGTQNGTLNVVVTRISNGESLTLTSKVWIPDESIWGPGPHPALIPMVWFSFNPNANYGGLPSSVLSARPIATVDFMHDQVAQYFSFGAPNHPFLRLYPEFNFGAQYDASVPGNIGKYAAWTWGISRLIDGLEIATDPDGNPIPIDMDHLAVTGCSYAGKMALFAGAFDERIALTIPVESGGGGATAWRVSQEIQGDREVETASRTDFSWFASPLRQFNRNNIYKLPHDHHELMAMVAPRALLATSNASQLWLSSKAGYVAARATEKVYESFGIEDRFGFIIDTGHSHCSIPLSQNEPIADFVDKFLLGFEDVETNVRDHLYGDDFDYERWTDWWGAKEPSFPRDWNPGNGKLVMSLDNDKPGRGHGYGHERHDGKGHGQGHNSLYVDDGGTVLAGYALKMPGPHPDATASLVGGSVQLDIANRDGRSYTLTVPFPDTSYAVPAGDNSWLPTNDEGSPLSYQGDAVAGFGGRVTGVYFSAKGLGQPPDGSGAGNPAGPGLFADTGDPVEVKFHADGGAHGAGGEWSRSATVTNENPDL